LEEEKKHEKSQLFWDKFSLEKGQSFLALREYVMMDLFSNHGGDNEIELVSNLGVDNEVEYMKMLF